VRGEVSLLLSQGHRFAQSYPVGTVWREARIARERMNHQIVNDAIMMQKVISSIMSKQGGQDFQETIKGLQDDV
jgi:hypothetical protein